MLAETVRAISAFRSGPRGRGPGMNRPMHFLAVHIGVVMAAPVVSSGSALGCFSVAGVSGLGAVMARMAAFGPNGQTKQQGQNEGKGLAHVALLS